MTARSWYRKAAFIWVDMERGLYDWEAAGKSFVPRRRDGSFRVVISQVMADCGIAASYGDNKWHESEEFQQLLAEERLRRDSGISDAVAVIEQSTGPLLVTREAMHDHVREIFLRQPDAEDPLALSPDQYQKGALAWTRYIDEQLGRSSSQKEHALDTILAGMHAERRITSEMMQSAVGLLREYRAEQDRRLSESGLLYEGEDDDGED